MATVSKIAENTLVVGNIHGEGDLDVLGRVKGDISVDGSVCIAASSQVAGSISAASIKVEGTVEGNITATHTLSIESAARVLGDLTTVRVSIAEGAVVRGMVRTDGAQTRAPQTFQRTPVRDEHDERVAPALRQAITSSPEVARPVERPEEVTRTPTAAEIPNKKAKSNIKRPPEPKVPALAKGTKGKKKGDKHAH